MSGHDLTTGIRGRRNPRHLALATLLVATWAGGSGADDYLDATRLRQAGEIVPLQQVLDSFEAHHGGRILEVELERRGDRYIYEIEFLNRRGRVREHEYDARTGELLRAKDHR